MRKKFCAALLVVVMLVSILPVGVFAAEYTWPTYTTTNRMPFRPEHGYVSEQNPPTFTWNNMGGNASSYELEVYEGYLLEKNNEGEITNTKAYSKKGITRNYFNMPETLTPGNYYWWRVRYVHKNSGTASVWTEPRKFRIDPDAYEFVSPDIDTLLGRIPTEHPRILTTPENLEEFKNYRKDSETSYAVYTSFINSANNYVNKYKAGTLDLSEPAFAPPEGATAAELGVYSQQYRGKVTTLATYSRNAAFAYLLADESNANRDMYAKVAKEAMMNALPISYKLDPYGDMAYDTNHPASYEKQDQIFREITYRCAMAYDWIHDTLTKDEKEFILSYIKRRVEYMGVTKSLFTKLESSPYESHGWTAFGFLGITAIATYGEIPEAEEWLKIIIPAYTAMLPPWSYQDGGWCQGTDYWQYSTMTNHEFMDVLALGGIIDLYKNAWAQNEYLWTLYAYPNGSYGSFGDQSNRTKASTGYSMNSVANEAYFNKSGIGKWLVESFGSKFNLGYLDSYYTSMLDDIESEPPTEYPLGHKFKDIGWAVMTDSLEDPGRIQMTFKSSYWGSFNHSHPDQNSFIIQAYGENLANKSGYYDAYHTEHDSTITRPSFAHNTITVDGGKGQLDDTMEAKGSLTQFVTQMDFDSVTGDATAAYRYVDGNTIATTNKTPDSVKGRLDKYVRSIIYIRPGVFVVIDDLKAYNSANGGKSSFEWWLNAEHEIEYDDNYALISEGAARLEANVVYPKNTTATYYDGFYSPIDNKHYPASGNYVGKNEQRRVKFATDKVSQTKMVVTMSVFREDEEAMPVSTEYAADGSYLKLTFGDGTVCLVNLGESDTEVSDGIYTFTGDALTYNDYSFVLTNGIKVTQQKTAGSRKINLVESKRPLTIAMGHNQIAFDVVGQGDDNDKTTKQITIAKGTEFVDINSKEELVDLKGRVPSPETGFVACEVRSTKISLWPDEGSYTLLASGSSVSVEGMVPKNVALKRIDDSTMNVVWEQKEAYDYDIIINGTIYENVSSPYELDISGEESVYSVAVRAKSGNILSNWSSFAFMSPFIENTYSHVSFTRPEGKIKAEVFSPNPGKDDLKLTLATYDSKDALLGMYPLEEKSNIYTVTVDAPEDAKAKVFLWKSDKMEPAAPMAVFNSNNLNLKGIKADGVEIPGYSDTKDEYTLKLDAGNIRMPAITAAPRDNATRVNITHDYPNMCSHITLIAQDETRRVITINYELEYEDIHVVAGADTEADFKDDTGRAMKDGVYDGKVSSSAVGTLTWDIVKVDKFFGTQTHLATKSKDIMVYTNISPHLSDGTWGSRLTSDREPNSGNHTEYTNPPREYWGYEHILFPNAEFCSLEGNYSGASIHNAKATFNLAESAELIILAKSANDNLLDQGFKREVLTQASNGRYLDGVGIEDVYYNVHILGKSKDDVVGYSLTSTVGPRCKTYEIAEDWVNVNSISGNKTLQDYIDNGYVKDNFVENGSCIRYANSAMYVYNYAYKKTVDVPDGNTEVIIDFGNYDLAANRMIMVVRPVTPRMPIDNFVYNGALRFSDLTDAQKGTDNASGHANLTAHAKLPVARIFTEDTLAYIDNSSYTITGIDPMLGIEGAWFIPPHYNVASTSSINSWMRAYYYGLGSCGGYEYPAFDNTPQPMYEFDLNTDSTLYILTYGDKPAFIDDTWQCIQLSKSAFTVDGVSAKFTSMYMKHIDVEEGTPVRVSALTPGTGSTSTGTYFMLIKPDDK